MARYIDADKLRFWIADVFDRFDVPIGDKVANAVYKQIDNAPTADVEEVKHGYWIENKPNPKIMKMFHDKGIGKGMSEESIFYTCSCCGTWGSLTQKHCSECGAKMDGGNNNDL